MNTVLIVYVSTYKNSYKSVLNLTILAAFFLPELNLVANFAIDKSNNPNISDTNISSYCFVLQKKKNIFALFIQLVFLL